MLIPKRYVPVSGAYEEGYFDRSSEDILPTGGRSACWEESETRRAVAEGLALPIAIEAYNAGWRAAEQEFCHADA